MLYSNPKILPFAVLHFSNVHFLTNGLEVCAGLCIVMCYLPKSSFYILLEVAILANYIESVFNTNHYQYRNQKLQFHYNIQMQKKTA